MTCPQQLPLYLNQHTQLYSQVFKIAPRKQIVDSLKPDRIMNSTMNGGIKCCMIQTIDEFFKHHMTDSCNQTFWDYVVISSADSEQKHGFELQLADEISKKLLPSHAQYLVIEDVPNSVSLGSGGSTFHILDTLEKKIKDFYSKKVLLVHAGGFSKRLPNMSCLGKLFCPLPVDFNGKALNLLCLKLILITPFLKLLNHGGLFICASDDIEPYQIQDLNNEWPTCELRDAELVALAHPSSLFIGSTHGVYVVPPQNLEQRIDASLTSCLEVLQKPSFQIMKEKAAIAVTQTGEEFVFTDSMFLCKPPLVKKMVAFARERRKDIYSEETCVYGDFLACMGTRPKAEKLYFEKVRSSSGIKREIAERFCDTKVKIMVLHQSRFIHLGTMPEYLEALNPSGELFNYLGMKPCVGSLAHNLAKLQGITLNCLLEAPVETMPNSIIESCIIRAPIFCESKTILSNCLIEDTEIKVVPGGWLFHTAAIKEEDKLLFVTIAFMVTDDLKGAIEDSFGWNQATGLPPKTPLWKAKLFKAHKSMGQSFLATWKLIVRVNKSQSFGRLYSMADVVQLKFLPAILEYRKSIKKDN